MNDDVDTCPDTPSGVSVDANGCADSQKVTDGDGVIANIDFTVGSTTGTSIIFDSANVIFLDVDGNSIAVTGLENGYIHVN